MAFNLGNLGDENGYIYEKLKSGAINSLPNTPEVAMKIMNRANKSRLIYTKFTEAALTEGDFTDQFQDDVYGSRYYLNAEVAAPIGDITGALDITKYVIAPTKCYKDQVTIDVDGEIDITRYSFNHVILLSPATGTEDTLNYMNHDFQPGDLVFFTLADDSTDTITINPNTVDNGNFKCQNGQAIILSGAGACALFIRDGSQSQITGGKGFLREIGRPNQQALDIANKNLTSGGGNYYALDVSTADAARIDRKQGLIVLGGGSTLKAPWNVFGEMVNSNKSVGTTLDIKLDSGITTYSYDGSVLTIFGITIPDILAKYAAFTVRAWFDSSDADPLNWDWRATLITEPLPIPEAYVWGYVFNPGGSGIDYMFEPVSVGESSTNAGYTISPSFNQTICKVNFRGILEMNANVSVGDEVIVGDNCVAGLMPNNDMYFPCYLMQADGTPIGTCIVAVLAPTIIFPSTFVPSKIKVIATSDQISIGYYVDFAPIQYYAEV